MNKLKLGDGSTNVGAGALSSGEEGVFFRYGGKGVGVETPSGPVEDEDVKLFMQFSNTQSIDVVINHLNILRENFGKFDAPEDWIDVELPTKPALALGEE